jgi:hypothetical protein
MILAHGVYYELEATFACTICPALKFDKGVTRYVISLGIFVGLFVNKNW